MESDAGSPAESAEEERVMKECFGLSFGWFMEGMIGDYEERRRCYNCPDFDPCQKMAVIKGMVQLRLEIGRAAAILGRAIGGSHSTRPFG